MTTRGQTTLDYLVGVTIFLLTIALIFAFIPASFEPLETDWGAKAMESDRAISHLAGTELAKDSQKPFILDQSKTNTFFSRPDANLSEDIGLPSTAHVNLTIQKNESNVIHRRGQPRPASGSVVTAKRSVLLDGSQYRLVIRVW